MVLQLVKSQALARLLTVFNHTPSWQLLSIYLYILPTFASSLEKSILYFLVWYVHATSINWVAL
jgi:hypothetical protein